MSTVPALVTNLLADTTNFDAALDKSGRKVHAFSKEVEKAGKAASKISAGLAVADIAGLEKLTAGSKAARAAVEGVTGALTLLGRIPLPLAIGVAAAGALATFVMRGDEAAKKADELAGRLDNLKKSAVDLAIAPKILDMDKAGQEVAKLEATISRIKGQIESTDVSLEAGAYIDVAGLTQQLAASTKSLEEWKERQRSAFAEVERVRKEFASKSLKASGDDALSQMGDDIQKADAQLRGLVETMEQASIKESQGAEAAMRYALAHGELARQVELDGDKGRAYADALIEYARKQDEATAATRARAEGEKMLAAAIEDSKRITETYNEERKRASETEIGLLSDVEKAYLQFQATRDEIYKRREAGVIDADREREELKRAEAQFASSTKRMSAYADQASRNIQSAWADWFMQMDQGLDGLLKSFIQTIQRMVAEQAAAKLFGPSSEGGLGWGDAIAGFFAGGFAKGGTIPAGKFGVVGENGPEIAVGPQTIIPPERLPTAEASAGATVEVAVAAPIINIAPLELPDFILQPAPSRDSPLGVSAPSATVVHYHDGGTHLTINGRADQGVLPEVAAMLAANNREQEKKIRRFLTRGI